MLYWLVNNTFVNENRNKNENYLHDENDGGCKHFVAELCTNFLRSLLLDIVILHTAVLKA